MSSEMSRQRALAGEAFDKFVMAATMKQVLSYFRSLCSILKLKPTNIQKFYPHLTANVNTWKAVPIFKKLDIKYNVKVYDHGNTCSNTKLLIIGAGPCGLRAAIEAQLLGAKVVVIEKRDRFSRNNVLHLWPFVIEDLKAVGAKKFLGRFCAGTINHISIRQLQLMLLKVCLILGVEIHEGVTFESIVEPNPNDDHGWRALLSPADHPVSKFEFDNLIGADGKRNTLPGFKRKEFRGKLAIAITANFINRRTTQEAKVPEISGISFVFNQAFFLGLKEKFCIDLENIVYYKDDTHYLVMTSKKQSLLDRKVLLEDYADTSKLLAGENINIEELKKYTLDAVAYATNEGLNDLEFAVNHYGEADVSIFDFTSMFTAENACRVVERSGYPLLISLVGDSLLEPFWPTGSGCARGFLSSLDACWAMRLWAVGMHPLHVIAERESIYRLLPQATASNLNTDILKYTVDPTTRYVALNKNKVTLHQVIHLYQTDVDFDLLNVPHRPSNIGLRRGQKSGSLVPAATLFDWISNELKREVNDLTESFRDGTVITTILKNYRPEYFSSDSNSQCSDDPIERQREAAEILRKLGVVPFLTAIEMTQLQDTHFVQMLGYMSKIYYLFKGEIPFTFQNEMESFDTADTQRMTESRECKNVSSNKKKRRSKRESVASSTNEEKQKRLSMSHDALLEWLRSELKQPVDNLTFAFRDGTILCKLIHKYRPNLLPKDEFDPKEDVENNETALNIFKDLGVPPLLHAIEMTMLSTYHTEKMIKYIKSIANLLKKDIQISEELRSLLEKEQTSKIKFGDFLMPNPERTKPKRKSDTIMKCTSIAGRKNIFEERKSKTPSHEERKVTTKSKQILSIQNQIFAREKYVAPVEKSPVVKLNDNLRDRVESLEFLLKTDHRAPSFDQEAIGDAKTVNKKPKDLMRAIGQINETDWQLRQLEKKIYDNKFGFPMQLIDKERVPKWDKMQFLDRQSKITDTDKPDERFKLIDHSLKQLDLKLKEGSTLETGERGKNRVSLLAGQFNKTKDDEEQNVQHIQKAFHHHNKVENCHVCDEPVYLMEKINPLEGLTMHKRCFKCSHCHTALKLSSYLFDREGKYGYNIFCPNHFGAKTLTKKSRSPKPSEPEIIEPDREIVEKGDTPERSAVVDDGQLPEIDEQEWTVRNFGSESLDNEKSGSEDDTSSDEFTSADSDNSDSDSSDDTYSNSLSYEYSTAGEEAEAGECTWGSEGRVLEQRRLEVAFGVAPSPTPSDTEIVSECDSKHSEAENATEVSTDSEFGPLVETPPVPAPPIINYPERYQRSTIKGIELKKKYLLGPQEGTMLQKSNSASELNSRFREFHSNISECQKLLHPASEISPSMQAFLDNSSRRNTSGRLSPIPRVEIMKPCGEVVPGIVDHDKFCDDSKRYLHLRNRKIALLPSPFEAQEEEQREITQVNVDPDEMLTNEILNPDETSTNANMNPDENSTCDEDFFARNHNSHLRYFQRYREVTKPLPSSSFEAQEEEQREIIKVNVDPNEILTNAGTDHHETLTNADVGLDETLTNAIVETHNMISGFLSQPSLELYNNDEVIPLTPLHTENIPSQSSSGTDNNITALNMDVRRHECNHDNNIGVVAIRPLTRNIDNALKTSKKLEELTKQKQKEMKAVHELVMDKMSKRTDRRRIRSSNLKNTSKDEPKLAELIRSNNSGCEGKTTDYTFSLPDIHQAVLERDFSVRQQMLSELDSLELPANSIQSSGIVPGFRQLSLSDFSGKLVQHVESLRKSGSFCKSEPNLFMSFKIHKDNERRKSIMKTVSDFFSRKRDTITRGSDVSPTVDKNTQVHFGHKIRNKSRVQSFEVAPPIPPLPEDYASAGTSKDRTLDQTSPLPQRLAILRNKLKNMLNGDTEFDEALESSLMCEILAIKTYMKQNET